LPKYGRGLNREIVGGVNRMIIKEPFSKRDIKIFTKTMSWDIPDAASEKHSLTYKKYFISW
jgi:hypothetical protein